MPRAEREHLGEVRKSLTPSAQAVIRHMWRKHCQGSHCMARKVLRCLLKNVHRGALGLKLPAKSPERCPGRHLQGGHSKEVPQQRHSTVEPPEEVLGEAAICCWLQEPGVLRKLCSVGGAW